MQPRVTVTIRNWAMAGWAVEKCGEVGKWGGGGQFRPGANPLHPPVGESFSVGGSRDVWEDWYLRLLSVGSLVSGLETAGGAGVCCEFREHSVGLVGKVVVSWVNSPSGVQRKISLGGTSNAK